MFDIRPVVFTLGLLLLVLAAAMLVPLGVSISQEDGKWNTFATSGAVTAFFGYAMVLSCRGPRYHINLRHVFLLPASAWLILPIFAALPFTFGESSLRYTDSFFEAMSGLTTTGATILPIVEDQPPSILIWRSILQWVGGIGTVLMAVTILPMLRVGGMQLFKTEAFDSPTKIFSRLSPLALRLVMLYTMLSATWFSLYWMAGMSSFDAINHAMTTLSSGGFSTTSASFAQWQSPPILLISSLGMIAAAMPFALYLQAYRGAWSGLFSDKQVAVFLKILTASVVVIAGWLIIDNHFDVDTAIIGAIFQTTSILSGTGYTATDTQLWGGLPIAILFAIQYIGGCAGSTTGGVKTFRFQVLYVAAKVQIARMLRPNLALYTTFDKRRLHGSVDGVMAFFFLYAMCVCLLTVGLSLSGLDFTTAFSGASSAISNLGPGLGEIIGPTGNYATLPDAAKWQLAFGMVVGRLEILSILVLLQPAFWRE